MSTHPFPMTEPEITITARPDAALTEVLRVDAGGDFVLLTVGAETCWSFYDWPERQLTNVCLTRVTGTVRYRGVECLELLHRIVYGEDDREYTRSLRSLSGETLGLLLSETRNDATHGKIEEVDASPMPLRLCVGMSYQWHEEFRCGDEIRRYAEVYRSIVDGPFEVALPTGREVCLRETFWSSGKPGDANVLVELYVSENGRSVLFRRFNGPTYNNYSQLSGNPEREHEGVTWRLWYECLPDIAVLGA